MTRSSIPNPFRFFVCLLSFIGFCTQPSQATSGGTVDDLSQLPLQLPRCAFNPKDFQRLKGEVRHEGNALKYLKRLEQRSQQLSKPEDAFTDPYFLKIRDQLADCFLKLFSYAVLLPGSNRFPPFRTTHANSLEEVTSQPLFMRLIDGIYDQRPLLRDTVDDVFNEELTRDDFNPRVYIGRNPFFQPLCILLNYLYNGSDQSMLGRMLEGTKQNLEKRHVYFYYLRPLERVTSSVDTAVTKNRLSVVEWLYNIKRLKDVINQNVDYRYGIDDKDPIAFPAKLIKARKSIPWPLFTTLGSAAHLATENRQADIQRMFVQAGPDLILDLKVLQQHLKELQVLEQDHFLGKELTEISAYSYPNIERFTAWYLNFVGLGMVKSHIQETRHFANSLDNASKVFDGYPRWQIDRLAYKLPFLQSKSRVFTLYYLFVDGELSKYFVRTLKGKVDKTWINLFEAFKALRDDIMHKTQAEGQKQFEERLNSLDSNLWSNVVESYTGLLSLVDELDKAHDQLRWKDLKEQDPKEIILSPDTAKKTQLKRLQGNLEHLSTFIGTGSWEDPQVALEKEYESAAEAFKKALPEKYHRQFSPASLLTKAEGGWQQTFDAFGKRVTPEMQTHWSEMQTAAKRIKDYKALAKKSKATKTSLQILTENLENLQWTLSQLSETYDKGEFSRFSSVPEARIAELYLVTLRESANAVLDTLPNHLVFDATDQETRGFFQASLFLSSVLHQIKSDLGNSKAHIHRLTEASLHEVHNQSVGNLIAGHLGQMQENAGIILNFLGQQP